ncbi:pfkB-like carbohydrate kinase family protein [Thalictrum thalictroides]|uniref:PfkB-like carbohydrate kinase family protein n=1 Tax=Thalictrum thalictroides TaxID=46969 RepID=A0A7J6WT29_THATH|nr:pfkB-like carbohydrate kinase family protein [Thalictrum thalictroides]
MHLQTLKCPTSSNIYISKSNLSQPHRLNNGYFPPIHVKFGIISAKCHQLSVAKNCSNSFSFSNDIREDGKTSRFIVKKDADIATLGNLCVDVVLNVPSLPPPSFEERRAYMDKLSASQPDKKYWEAGGNCNMVIAAARLGLSCLSLGHVGDEIYGNFLLDVLHEEGIGMVEMSEESDLVADTASYETLLCWVLVDPLHRHGFCSRADFSKDPAFNWMSKISGDVKSAIKRSKILFCNGYAYDELSPSLLVAALEYAIEVGTSIFFDPGPRGRTLKIGTPEQQRALDQYLRMSDVLLLTSDEAESLTGVSNPILAGQELLRKGKRTKWVIVKMGPKGSILITKSSVSCAPAFKVNVIDTVGCGDSYTAAIAYGFLHDMPAVNTLTLANAVGAATATGCGAGRNVATLTKVIELLKESNLNEDNFLSMFVDEKLDIPEVRLLTKKTILGSNGHLKQVILQKVVAELLSKLEVVLEKRMVPS